MYSLFFGVCHYRRAPDEAHYGESKVMSEAHALPNQKSNTGPYLDITGPCTRSYQDPLREELFVEAYVAPHSNSVLESTWSTILPGKSPRKWLPEQRRLKRAPL